MTDPTSPTGTGADISRVTGISDDRTHGTFELDLAGHEAWRRAEVFAALGDDWDPVAVMQDEAEAQRLLYSGLDADQQTTYAMLVAAGVLPAAGQG
ncbi:DUF6400 family protein [Streptomyces noursei]|uniref:Uncharacterized protein n=1 Tax=Streptomyces noursei TaxID=1971 RepID=A0A401RCF8_STRNR|nr:DUF6400 family protein [Streptomyces noursei]EPY93140.1 hypothetical protein K530_49625 [Streptomyces noursei CCRC 11814]MCZ0975719.1 DUF6400 family protein [Streptomyces noursei]UWS75949.1 DUF6400 family protein [Streptomyces noursei]GCB95307.1 hypothetical protein SALB_08111 [Streptomyces noursei]